MTPDPEQMMTDLRFWQIAMEEGRRTIICHPDHEARIVELLAAHGQENYHRVIPSPYMAKTEMFIVPFHEPAFLRRPLNIRFERDGT